MKGSDLDKNNKLKVLLEKLESDDQNILKDFISELVEQFGKTSLNSIWHEDINAVSYWIVIINGINNTTEIEVAKSMLFWKEFFAGSTSKIRCIQSSEIEYFNHCMNEFNISSCPTIIFSNNKDFGDYIRIDSEVINELQKHENGLQNFYTRIHSMIIRKKSIKQINKILMGNQFWKYFKITYNEVKSFFSINIKADIGE